MKTNMTQKQKERVDKILEVVAMVNNIPISEITSKGSRNKYVVLSKKVCMYLIKNDPWLRRMTLASVGELFKTDHSNTIHHLRRCEEAMTPDRMGKFTSNPSLRKTILDCQRLLDAVHGIKPTKPKTENLWALVRGLEEQRDYIENEIQIAKNKINALYQ